MALEPEMLQKLDNAIRALSTASRSLRLYPAASPIPGETVSTAITALEAVFSAEPRLLSVFLARDGFTYRGEPVAANVQGASELAGELRGHGVAEIGFEPGVTAEELLDFLAISARASEEVRAAGGLDTAVSAAGIEHVRLVEVQLVVADSGDTGDELDYEEFLRDLVRDSDKLTAWFTTASSGDPASFDDGLVELIRVAGADGLDQLLGSMRTAFLAQSGDGKDALLGLSLKDGPVRDMTGRLFGMLDAPEIAGSVLGGVFGKNMLSLSSALTSLPLDQAAAEVRAEVQAMLPTAGHTSEEATFLQHMLEVRGRNEAELSLVDADRTYKAVVQASILKDEDVARARTAMAGSVGALSTASVRTMLSLLDEQRNFELYCAGADNLAGMVPILIEQGDLTVAARVLTELASREARGSVEWPELSNRLRAAIAKAVGARSMEALVTAVMADPRVEPAAAEIVRHGGEACGVELVGAAIAHKDAGLEVADHLIGRRLIDRLHAVAGNAQWFQLTPIVARLAEETDPRSVATVEALLARPDEQSRREVATALAGLSTPTALRLLTVALRDSSLDVATVAARAIAKGSAPGSAAILSARLAELDVDTNDFALARELITCLARTPDPAADGVLARMSARRVLIKRGHYVEIQQLVAQAQALRSRESVTS